MHIIKACKTRLCNFYEELKYDVLCCLYHIFSSIPKKKNIWVFGAWDGNMYADNSKYLFEYIRKNHPEIRCVWITRKNNVLSDVREKGYEAYNRKTIQGIWICLRASVGFVTQGRADIFGIFTAGAMIVQLWHGMGIKDVQKSLKMPRSSSGKRYYDLVHSYKHQVWMVGSEEAIKKYSEALDVPKEQFFITGQPKDDTFINEKSNRWIEDIRERSNACIVAYLPTHRDFGRKKTNSQVDMLSYEKLLMVNEKLKKANIIMIFKPHFHEFKNYEGLNTNLSNIVFATDINVFGDVYEFLPACDALITDYSGIMLGFLNNCKPQVYFPYDMEDYQEEDMGFCYPYREVAVGPICYEWEQVVSALEEIFKEDIYFDERLQLRERFCFYHDGKNCERVYLKTLELLDNKWR